MKGKKSRKQKGTGASGLEQKGQLDDVSKGTVVAVRASKRQKKLGLSDDSSTNPVQDQVSTVDLPFDTGIKTSDRIDAETGTFQVSNKVPETESASQIGGSEGKGEVTSKIDSQGKMSLRRPQQGNNVAEATQVEPTIIPREDQGGVAAINELELTEGEKERQAAVAVLEAGIAAATEKKVALDQNEKESATVDIAAEKKAKRMAALAQLKAKKMAATVANDPKESNTNNPPSGNEIPP